MQSLVTLRVFLDSLEEGVLFLDAGRKVLEMNVAAQRMLGQVDDSFIGSLCPSLFAGTACARECEIRGHCSLMRAQDEDRKVQDVTLKGPDGADMSLRMWAMLLPPNDSALACAIILRDCSREIALETEVRERWQLGGLIGRSRTMQNLYQNVLRAAASDANVLVTGESGVGKELVARALHDNSSRSTGPYVAVHCASLSEHLLESELFGHAKGAFSGAVALRLGRFEAASGGTLLLDEIGEISLAIQTKLLRVLQEREVRPVGAARSLPVDVRVISATHRDLDNEVASGRFREDLYYRLNVVNLKLPPLAERREDIPLLAGHFLAALSAKYRKKLNGFAADATEALMRSGWPGNVRQLFNVVEKCVALSTTPIVPLALVERALNRPGDDIASFDDARRGFERDYLVQLLKMTAGNVTNASRIAKRNRSDFYTLLNRHQIDPANFKA